MSDQLRLDIPLLLPEVADTADRCVARLTSELEGREGVDKVHVVRSSDASPPQLCIHYRPDILPLERVRQLARSAGAELTGQYQHLFWDDLEGVGHARRARTIGLKLREMPGVIEAEVGAAGTLRAEFQRSETSIEAIRKVLSDMGVTRKSAAVAAAVPAQAGHVHGDDGHDHGPDQPCCYSPRGSPGVDKFLVFIFEPDIERLRKVLAEVVRRSYLQRTPVTH